VCCVLTALEVDRKPVSAGVTCSAMCDSAVCCVLTVLEVDGKPASAGVTCSAVCDSAVCCVLTALEVDGKPVSAGVTCSAVCGSAMPLICTVNNCSSCQLSNVTLQVLSVDVVQSGSANSNVTDRHGQAVCDDSAVVIGSLMSTLPQVCLLDS